MQNNDERPADWRALLQTLDERLRKAEDHFFSVRQEIVIVARGSAPLLDRDLRPELAAARQLVRDALETSSPPLGSYDASQTLFGLRLITQRAKTSDWERWTSAEHHAFSCAMGYVREQLLHPMEREYQARLHPLEAPFQAPDCNGGAPWFAAEKSVIVVDGKPVVAVVWTRGGQL